MKRSISFHALCFAVALAFVSAVAGCGASGYMPAPSPRVSLMVNQGTMSYVRDGRSIPMGALGGGLVEAVRGVPQAEHVAQEYRRLSTLGFILVITGGVLALSAAVAIPFLFTSSSSLGGALAMSLLVTGGLTVEIVGVSIQANAVPKHYDAINIYNDAVSPALVMGIPIDPVRSAPRLPPPGDDPVPRAVPSPPGAQPLPTLSP